MLRVLSWYILERLVRIPAFMFMSLHELLMYKVLKTLREAERKN